MASDKTYRFTGHIPLEWKMEALKHVYAPGDTSQSLADKLTKLTKTVISRSSVIGFYHRYKDAVETLPLSGGGKSKSEHRAKNARRTNVGRRSAPSLMMEPIPSVRSISAQPRKTVENAVPVFVAPKQQREASQPSVPDDSDSKRIPLMELDKNQCRWPTHKDKRGHLFCGHTTGVCQSYCAKHEARNWQRRRPARGYFVNSVKSVAMKERV